MSNKKMQSEHQTVRERHRASSQTRLPIPSVLVIGDYESEGQSFVRLAWRQIESAYNDLPLKQAFGKLPDVFENENNGYEDPWVRPIPERLPPRTMGPTLYPIAFSDRGHADRRDFRYQLLRHLAHFDVWSIIACGTASNTQRLIDELQPIDIPILVIVDSTVESAHRPLANILRLIPNNELQATALLAKSNEILAADHSKLRDRHVQIYCASSDSPYVDDLATTIQRLTKHGVAEIRASMTHRIETIASIRKPQIVVCIGYTPDLRKILNGDLAEGSTLILSDGFFNEDTLALIQQTKNVRRYEFYWAHAPFSYAEYARDAYVASVKTWQRFVNREPEALPSLDRLAPPIDRIKAFLENSIISRYSFNGSENQRGGFLVDPIPLSVIHENVAGSSGLIFHSRFTQT